MKRANIYFGLLIMCTAGTKSNASDLPPTLDQIAAASEALVNAAHRSAHNIITGTLDPLRRRVKQLENTQRKESIALICLAGSVAAAYIVCENYADIRLWWSLKREDSPEEVQYWLSRGASSTSSLWGHARFAKGNKRIEALKVLREHRTTKLEKEQYKKAVKAGLCV